jgi:topoisomerase IA-like protein
LHNSQEFKDSGIWSHSVVEETTAKEKTARKKTAKEKTTQKKTAKESDVVSWSSFHLKAYHKES